MTAAVAAAVTEHTSLASQSAGHHFIKQPDVAELVTFVCVRESVCERESVCTCFDILTRKSLFCCWNHEGGSLFKLHKLKVLIKKKRNV